MRVLLLKKYKKLKEGEYEIKDIEGNLVEDGRTRTAVVIEEGGKEISVPIDLVEFL
jgi:hypothetical protein